MRTMTPLQVRMMLHYYAIAEPYAASEEQHARSVAVQEQRDCLIANELIETDCSGPSGYRVTERGLAYIEALLRLPLPIKKWVMPDAA